MIIKLTDAFDGKVDEIDSDDIRAMFRTSNSTTVIMFNNGMLITVLETTTEIEKLINIAKDI
ncbi:hypothetical protein ABM133_08545 [Enterococcus cecorum]|uniref:hypothetical protein n=1 Tax=Enterococcus cecorum TaxID=44008 RepID=UPI0032C4A1AB